MSATTELHAQVAQRLFGWRWQEDAQLWRAADGVSRDDASWRRRLPAYSTDPAATALVWQWLETQRGQYAWDMTFGYWEHTVRCRIFQWTGAAYTLVHEVAPTWPEALCRAALALAAAVEQGEDRPPA